VGHPVTIIGAGLVGLATAWHLLRRDHPVTVISREPPGVGASVVNAGANATADITPLASLRALWQAPAWLFDPLGPLSLRWRQLPAMAPWLLWRFAAAAGSTQRRRNTAALGALMASATDDHQDLLHALGAESLLTGAGALFVYRSAVGRAADQEAWDLRKSCGVAFAEVTRADIEAREPALGPAAHCGYFVPGWRHYGDPRDLVLALSDALTRNGCQFVSGEVSGIALAKGRPRGLRLKDG